MPHKERVGRRIRQVRTEQHKTLRQVESASGFSSTHISEIERGRTSPTIGALIQIARALEKDPSYFIEDRELDEVSVTSEDGRVTSDPAVFDLEGDGIALESLTAGILGGRLQALMLTLEPGAEARVSRLEHEEADLFFFCLEGSFDLRLPESTVRFDDGDSLHGCLKRPLSLHNRSAGTTRLLIFLDPANLAP